MARKAASAQGHSASGGFIANFQHWVKTHPEETKVSLIFAAVAFIFTQGLPLWDSDYSFWLSQPEQNFGKLIFRVLLPFTSSPGTWGYSDQPLQALFYKIFFTVFGSWGTGWFFFKSLAFGGLCGTLWHWMRRMNLDRWAIWASLALFAVSSNVVTSLVIHSDWTVYGQLLLAIVLFWSLHQLEGGPTSRTVYRKGWGGMPKGFRRFLITFFVCVYFGAKLHADLRLAPLVLLGWLWVFRREKFHVYWAPFAATFALTLPWSADLFKRLPPFLPGVTGYQGVTYSSFGFGRLFQSIASDVFHFDWSSAPASLLGAVGIVVVLGLAAYAGYRAYCDDFPAPNEHWGLHLIWLGWALLACVIAPASDTYFGRFFMMPLVPVTMLLAMTMHSAIHEFPKFPQMRKVVAAIVAIQCVLHFAHAYEVRRDLGHRMVAVEQLHRSVEQNYADAQLVYGPGFDTSAYRASTASALNNAKSIGSYEGIKDFPTGKTFIAVWTPTLDAKFSVEKVYNGCGGSVFDVIAPCSSSNTHSAMLIKYVGDQPEVAQAYKFDNERNFAAARQLLDSVWAKDNGNIGIGFMLALEDYRLGDLAKMEEVYDKIGPYLMGNVSAVYNWGLAKQGVQKFAEASRLLERAFEMAPNDYAIGFNLADSYYHEGKKTRALATLGDMLQKYPNSETMKRVYQNWQKQ